MNTQSIVAIITLIETLIPTIGAIISEITNLVNNLSNATPEEKEALIARIKAAQAKLPEWK